MPYYASTQQLAAVVEALLRQTVLGQRFAWMVRQGSLTDQQIQRLACTVGAARVAEAIWEDTTDPHVLADTGYNLHCYDSVAQALTTDIGNWFDHSQERAELSLALGCNGSFRDGRLRQFGQLLPQASAPSVWGVTLQQGLDGLRQRYPLAFGPGAPFPGPSPVLLHGIHGLLQLSQGVVGQWSQGPQDLEFDASAALTRAFENHGDLSDLRRRVPRFSPEVESLPLQHVILAEGANANRVRLALDMGLRLFREGLVDGIAVTSSLRSGALTIYPQVQAHLNQALGPTAHVVRAVSGMRQIDGTDVGSDEALRWGKPVCKANFLVGTEHLMGLRDCRQDPLGENNVGLLAASRLAVIALSPGEGDDRASFEVEATESLRWLLRFGGYVILTDTVLHGSLLRQLLVEMQPQDPGLSDRPEGIEWCGPTLRSMAVEMAPPDGMGAPIGAQTRYIPSTIATELLPPTAHAVSVEIVRAMANVQEVTRMAVGAYRDGLKVLVIRNTNSLTLTTFDEVSLAGTFFEWGPSRVQSPIRTQFFSADLLALTSEFLRRFSDEVEEPVLAVSVATALSSLQVTADVVIADLQGLGDLAKATSCCRPGGRLIVLTPDDSSWLDAPIRLPVQTRMLAEQLQDIPDRTLDSRRLLEIAGSLNRSTQCAQAQVWGSDWIQNLTEVDRRVQFRREEILHRNIQPSNSPANQAGHQDRTAGGMQRRNEDDPQEGLVVTYRTPGLMSPGGLPMSGQSAQIPNLRGRSPVQVRLSQIEQTGPGSHRCTLGYAYDHRGRR